MAKYFKNIAFVILFLLSIGLSQSFATVVYDTSGDVITDKRNHPVSDTNGPPLLAPGISTQPVNATVAAPATATFSVVAVGNPSPNYQWMQEMPGTSSFTAISGSTSASYTTPATTTANNNTEYECIVSTVMGAVTSNAVTLFVSNGPSIITQPVSALATSSETATFNLVATGVPAPTYQWQQMAPGASLFIPISGATNATYTTPATTSANNQTQYDCIVSNSSGSVTSNIATLTISGAPKIILQPSSQTVAESSTATFTVNAIGEPAPTYQWMQEAPKATTYTAISGETNASYTVLASSTAISTTKYKCVVTNSIGSVTSNVVILTVNPIAVPDLNGTIINAQTQQILTGSTWKTATPITVQGPYGSVKVKLGVFPDFQIINLMAGTYNMVIHVEGHIINYSFTITPNSIYNSTTLKVPFSLQAPSAPVLTAQIETSPYSYALDWSASTDIVGIAKYTIVRNGTVVANTTNTSWTDTNITPSTIYSYQVYAYDEDGNSSVSNTVTVTSPPLPTPIVLDLHVIIINAQTQEALTAGKWTKLPTVQGPYGPAKVTLGKFPDFQIFNLIAGSYTMVIDVEGHNINYSFSIVQNSPYNNAPLEVPFSLQAPSTPVLTAQINSSSYTIGLNWSTSTDIVGIAKYTIERNAIVVANTTDTSWTDPNSTPGTTYSYKVYAYDQDSNSSVSNIVTVTLPALQFPNITTQPVNATVIAPATATFTVVATGVPTSTYQWMKEASGDNGYSVINGATNASYTTPATSTANNGTSYECIVTNDVGSVTSTAATLTVKPVSSYVQSINYNASGQITQIQYGNGTTTAYTYNPLNFRLMRIYTSNAQNQVIQDLNYTYDSIGQVLSVTDNVNTGPASMNQTYSYDALNRLTTASGSYGNKTYAYDSIGNITQKDGLTYIYAEANSRTNGTAAGPHAVTSLSGGSTFKYDANGNMVTLHKGSNTTQYAYDSQNRLQSVTVGGLTAATYTYDGDGGRTQKTVYRRDLALYNENTNALLFGSMTNPQSATAQNPTVDTTIYLGDLFESESATDGSSRQTKFIYLGNRKVALIDGSGNTFYYHTDHLGGTNVLTDSAGEVRELTEYDPFGLITFHEKYGSDFSTAWYYFTGKHLDDETGLIFLGARYYNPVLGRFITPDTVVQAPSNPQTLNRYTYCNNNPVNLLDPTGHSWIGNLFKSIFKAIGSFLGIFGTIINDAINGNFSQLGKQVLIAGISAVASILLPGLGAFSSDLIFNVVGNAFVGAVEGAIIGGVSSVIMGGTFAQGAEAGAIGGAIGGAVQGFTSSQQFQNWQAGKGFESNVDVQNDIAKSIDWSQSPAINFNDSNGENGIGWDNDFAQSAGEVPYEETRTQDEDLAPTENRDPNTGLPGSIYKNTEFASGVGHFLDQYNEDVCTFQSDYQVAQIQNAFNNPVGATSSLYGTYLNQQSYGKLNVYIGPEYREAMPTYSGEIRQGS